MRGKRAKEYRKLMKQYGLAFGFREPYQVLVDAQMIQDMTKFAMEAPRAFERTLSSTVKPMITQCSMRHLYELSTTGKSGNKELPEVVQQRFKESCITIAKTMERRRCNHHTLDKPLSTLECLSSVIDPKSTHTDEALVNKFNYVVAAQDEDLRFWCRRVLGVPLIYVKRSVMIMEPMTQSSQGVRDRGERGKLRAGLKSSEAILGKRKRDVEAEMERKSAAEANEAADKADAAKKKQRNRGPKGPNPLSVKKPKKEATEEVKKTTPAIKIPDIGEWTTVIHSADDDSDNDDTPKDSAPSNTLRRPTPRKRKRKHKPSTLQQPRDAVASDADADAGAGVDADIDPKASP